MLPVAPDMATNDFAMQVDVSVPCLGSHQHQQIQSFAGGGTGLTIHPVQQTHVAHPVPVQAAAHGAVSPQPQAQRHPTPASVVDGNDK
jgi:hypothetical protein